jgi:type I site-specific restriction-modification system R (restriction) subunit
MRYTEDTLIQQTTADCLHDELGRESVYAYNDETFGPEGMLGRRDDHEVILTRYLGEALVRLNPGLPREAYQDAIRQITDYSLSQSPLQINQEKYDLFKDGAPVQFRNDKGELVRRHLRVFDFNESENNHFLTVRELWVRGVLYRRRADLVGFVNGISLLFMELKNLNKNTRAAYERNLADYKDTVPHLFHHNAFIVLGNGVDARMGSLSSRSEHFHLEDIIEKSGFARNRAIIDAKEAVNENDESRKRFEILAREVFKKFRACLTMKGVNDYRRQYDAINIIYTSLQADRESTRALQEGLDEETLALFDLLLKPDLSKKEIERLKQVATELLAKLKAEKLRADNWWEKQATRDAVKVETRDFLWNEETGLPVDSYSEYEVEDKAERVYVYVFNTYTSGVASPVPPSA